MRSVPLFLAAALLTAAPGRAQDPAPSPTPAPAKPAASAGADGFTLQSADGEFRLQLRGYVHFDGRFFMGDDGSLATDTFLLRRVRPILQGALGKYFDFRIMPDFGQGTTVLQEAWLDFKPSPAFSVQVGKYKSPVGLERLQSATAISFVERAFPTNVLPNRDLGIMVHGELGKGLVNYAAAVLRRRSRRRQRRRRHGGRQGPRGPGDAVAVQPGASRRSRTWASASRAPPASRRAPCPPTARAARSASSRQPPASPPTARAGAIRRSFRTTRGPSACSPNTRGPRSRVRNVAGDHFDFRSKAWQTTATFVLTGEKASFAGVRPKNPFDPSKGQWGAIELAARVHKFELGESTIAAALVDPAKSPRSMSAWTLGVNWSLTRNVKQVFDFEHVNFKGGAADGGNRDAENTIFIRTQIISKESSHVHSQNDCRSRAGPCQHGRGPGRSTGAAERFLRPDPRAVPGRERRIREAVQGEDRQGRDRPAVARRLGQAGPRRDRRPRSGRRDAGARVRHRRHRVQPGSSTKAWQKRLPQQQRALHLDDRVPGAQGQPQGHQGLERPGEAGHPGDHAQPEDLGRRALELPGGLGLRPEAAGRQRRQGAANS